MGARPHNPLDPEAFAALRAVAADQAAGKGLSDVKRTFAAIVRRTSKWDQSKPPQEQTGFDGHARFMGGLEADGFIVLAGLMLASNDVLFILQADSEDEVQTRLGQDPWRQDGHTSLVRLEEIGIRTWAPSPQGG